MSNKLMKQCRVFRMTLTAKAVLMALADMADDDGRCWPSLETLADYTCASRRAVIDAIKYLESTRVLVSDRSNGRKTTYTLIPENFVPVVILSARTQARRESETSADAALVGQDKPVQLLHWSDAQTSADAAPVSGCEPVQMPHGSEEGPVQMPHPTRANAAPHPCKCRTEPVQMPHSNHQEPPYNHQENHQLGGEVPFDVGDQEIDEQPSVKPKKSKPSTKFDAAAMDLPDWLPLEFWQMWVLDREERKKPLTKRGAVLSIRSLEKLHDKGHTPQDVIEHAIASGYQGLYEPPRRIAATHTTTRRATSHNGLDTKNYREGVTDDGFIGA